MYTLILMTQAQKDAKKLSAQGLKEKTLKLLKIIKENPFQYPPEYEFASFQRSALECLS